jgi:hypothetical protein
VQGTLFKVHRYLLKRDSDILRCAFDNAKPEADGFSDATPFVFNDLEEGEFVTLLDFYYEGYVTKHIHQDLLVYSLRGLRMFTDTVPSTLPQWINLLSISTRFSFSRIRKRAISELSINYTVDPVQKIVLAESFSVPEWKKPAFMNLVQRKDPIQYEEAIRLGLKTSHGLCMAREKIWKSAGVANTMVWPATPRSATAQPSDSTSTFQPSAGFCYN